MAPIYIGGYDNTAVENLMRIRQFVRVRLKSFSIFASVLLSIGLFAGCQKAAPPVVATPNIDDYLPKHAQPKLPTMKIFFGSYDDKTQSFRPNESLDAELALTPEQEMTGMMYRTNIQETDSMLFVLPQPQRASFWMKNCPESISCAYIGQDGAIREIHHLEQNDTNAVVAATDDIQFVLETKEGWFTRHNIGVGTVIRTEKGSLADTFLH